MLADGMWGSGTLSALHQGIVRAPISFCAFGLTGTMGALSEVGVSRLSRGCAIHLQGIVGHPGRR